MICAAPGTSMPGSKLPWEAVLLNARPCLRRRRRARLAGALDWPVPSSRGRGAGPGRLNDFRAVGQRLAAQPGGDAAGFADRGRGGLAIAEVAEVVGVVEQAV